MTVIANTTLLIRRISEVRRRRDALVDRQDRLRGSLPQWALAPLQLVGLTASEIQGLMTDLSEAEKQAGLDDVERELEQLDQQIEELENLLLTTPSRSLDGIQAVLDMAVTRFRSQTVTDPGDVFYDYGDARILVFLERASEDLRGILVGRAAPGELTAPRRRLGRSAVALAASSRSLSRAASESWMFSSLSCFSPTVPGAPRSSSSARCDSGKAVTSRRFGVSASSMTIRSTPGAMPPCGGAPYCRARNMPPNFSSSTSRP